MICGDFNIHVDCNDDEDALLFSDLLESVGLQQHIYQPTHNNGHTLDLILTRYSDSIINKQPRIDRFLSDHA